MTALMRHTGCNLRKDVWPIGWWQNSGATPRLLQESGYDWPIAYWISPLRSAYVVMSAFDMKLISSSIRDR